MVRTRSESIDVLRGLAIISVVIGHIIQGIYLECDDDYLFKLIYSVHMPLFFSISGYLIAEKKLTKDWLLSRAQRLLVPFIIWELVAGEVLYSSNVDKIIERFESVIKDPSVGLWFLWILFLCDTFFYIINLLNEKFNIHKIETKLFLNVLLFLPLATICILFHFPTTFGLRLFCKEILFFAIGYYYKEYKAKTNIDISSKKKEAIIIAYLLLAIIWKRDSFTIFHIYISKIWIIGELLLYYLTTFLGIVTWIFIARIIVKITSIKKVFSIIGNYTLEIYIMQGYFAFRFYDSSLLILLSFFANISIPIILGYGIRNIPIVNILLLGYTKKK